MTFSELADRYLASKIKLRPSTARSYQSLIDSFLRPAFGKWKLETIKAPDVEQFRNELMRGVPSQIADALTMRAKAAHPTWSQGRAKQAAARRVIGPRTINKALTVFAMAMNYGCRLRLIDYNPVEYVERLPDPRGRKDRPIDDNVLLPAEIARLIDAAHGVYRRVIQFAAMTGMRQGEIFGLQWPDFEWSSRQVHVRRSWKEGAFHAPKTRASERLVDLPEMLMRELRAWKLQCPPSELDLVFPNQAGQPQSHSNFMERGFYPALARARLRRIRFHDLRHTFASLLLANGEDIIRVSRLLGHASPNITLSIYSHALPRVHYGSTDKLANLIYPTKSASLAA